MKKELWCAVHLPKTLTTKQEVPRKVIWLETRKIETCNSCERVAIARLVKKVA